MRQTLHLVLRKATGKGFKLESHFILLGIRKGKERKLRKMKSFVQSHNREEAEFHHPVPRF